MVIAEQIAAKEVELEQARAALRAAADYQSGVRSRTKTHVVRMDGALRRAGLAANNIRRLERELEALRRQATEPEPTPLDLTRLPNAQYIRTGVGWYEVVKVNRKSVKVVVAPGWDDLIPISRIVEIRERAARAATSSTQAPVRLGGGMIVRLADHIQDVRETDEAERFESQDG